ncbi:MAG: MurR/RpiR family transcriptional regulator [Acidimicrobiia bacterium]
MLGHLIVCDFFCIRTYSCNSGSKGVKVPPGQGGAIEPESAQPVTTYAELVAHLQEDFERLTPSHQKIARLVMEDPTRCAFMTIGELAGQVGVNSATVTRFATTVCGGGYPRLVELCRDHLLSHTSLVKRFQDLEEVEEGDLIDNVAAREQANIASTFAGISSADWDKAVQALAEAPDLHIIGLRKSFSIAYMLSYALSLIREGVHRIESGPATIPEQVRGISPGDVCVAISIHRYTRDTIRVLKLARDRGATTIALTDTAASPLARHADLAFYVETESVGILRSLTAFMSLVQALAAATARRIGAETRRALLLEEELLSAFDTYEQGP